MHVEPAYIVGLVDGEGCFSVRFNSSKRRRAKVDMSFSVKLRAIDRDVLDQLRSSFGCGGVYIQRDRRPNHQLCYRYEVTAKRDLSEIIVPFFHRHAFRTTTKQRDFSLFSSILTIVLEKGHRTEEGVKTILTLKQQMHMGSPDAGNPLVRWERDNTSKIAIRPSSQESREYLKSPPGAQGRLDDRG